MAQSFADNPRTLAANATDCHEGLDRNDLRTYVPLWIFSASSRRAWFALPSMKHHFCFESWNIDRCFAVRRDRSNSPLESRGQNSRVAMIFGFISACGTHLCFHTELSPGFHTFTS